MKTPSLGNGAQASALLARGVVFLTDSLQVGGSELNAVRTAIQLKNRGVPIRIFCLGTSGPIHELYAREGITVEFFRTGALWKPKAWRTLLRIHQHLRMSRPVAIHAHDIYSNVVAALVMPRLAGVRLFTSQRWIRFPSKAWRILNHRAYRASNTVVVNSPALKALVAEQAHVKRNRIAVVPNHIDAASLGTVLSEQLTTARNRLAAREPKLVFTVVARLSHVKNHDLLLRAFQKTAPRDQRWQLVVVGDGPERERLEALAINIGLAECVIFTGALPNAPSPHLLGDVAVLSSIAEGFPNSLLEAMVLAKPVVSTAVGGVPDVVQDGVTGLLVASGDVDAFAQAMLRIGTDQRLRHTLGENAATYVMKEHWVERVIDNLINLYESPEEI